MPDPDRQRRLDEWNSIKTYCRGASREPLVINESIASCVCQAVPGIDKLRYLARYLIGNLAQHVPISPVKVWLYRSLGARIGKNVFISPGVIFDPLFPDLITIEDDVLLGLGSRLLTHEYTASSFRLARIHIGRGAVIGAWALVRSGVTIGSKATIGAYSFVNRDVPEAATAVGVPARILPEKSES